MEKKQIITGVMVDENVTISFIEICQKFNISEQTLTEMEEHGLFTIESKDIRHSQFDLQTLQRIQSASRLHHDLGINIPGVVLVLELLDELELVQSELNILKKHLE